jgi:hypothetical protein
MATATYDKIATTTLGSAAASITFSSIAASWTDLRLVFVGTTSTAYTFAFTLNGASSGYSVTHLFGDGNSASSTSATSQAFWASSSNTSITIPTMFTLDLFSYSGSTYKTGLITGSNNANVSGRTSRTVGLYQSTSAITSITLASNFSGSTLSTGTIATLYGIKAA